MRMLLVVDEAASRSACNDYYEARGCTVDTAAGATEAEPLLRFRAYDMVVADCPSAEPARGEMLDLLGRARRKSPVRVLLTTHRGQEVVDDSLFVMTKPCRLDAILSLGTSRVAAG
jgi:DNA-binding response OmpR family regulator